MMDGEWMDGWLVGWMGWMGWLDGWLDGWMVVCMDGSHDSHDSHDTDHGIIYFI